MANGPQAVVSASTLTAPKYGLLASSPPVTDNERWAGGFGYAPDPCPGQGDIIDVCEPDSFTPPDNSDTITFEPFIIREGFRCSTIGFSVNDYEAKARRLLVASQSFHVAKEFWTGAWAKAQANDNAYLAHPDTDVVATGATPANALACLEQAFAQSTAGQPAMIHATPQIVTLWKNAELVEKDGNLIVTVLGSIVVPDAGYDGSRWDGGPAASGSIWAYASSLVQVRLGPIEVIPGNIASATARTTNTVEVQVVRPAAVTMSNCYIAAVSVDANLCGVAGS